MLKGESSRALSKKVAREIRWSIREAWHHLPRFECLEFRAKYLKAGTTAAPHKGFTKLYETLMRAHKDLSEADAEITKFINRKVRPGKFNGEKVGMAD